MRQVVWRPGDPSIIAVSLTDGQIMMVQLNGSVANVDATSKDCATACKKMTYFVHIQKILMMSVYSYVTSP